MADVAEDLGDVTEDIGDFTGDTGEMYSVLVRFVINESVSESAALNFLERVKGHYGFTYEPMYMLGDAKRFDWKDKDKTKRGMARTYVFRGLPTEAEADKFAGDLEAKKGIDWAYRDVPFEIDEDDPYLNPDMNIDDKIEGLMKG